MWRVEQREYVAFLNILGSVLSIGSSLIGAGTSAYGAYRSSQAAGAARKAYAQDAALAIDQGERDAQLAIDQAMQEIGAQRAYFASRGFRAGAGGSSSAALRRQTVNLAYEDAQNILKVAENRAHSIRLAGASAVNKANADALSSLGNAGAYLARGAQHAVDKWG